MIKLPLPIVINGKAYAKNIECGFDERGIFHLEASQGKPPEEKNTRWWMNIPPKNLRSFVPSFAHSFVEKGILHILDHDYQRLTIQAHPTIHQRLLNELRLHDLFLEGNTEVSQGTPMGSLCIHKTLPILCIYHGTGEIPTWFNGTCIRSDCKEAKTSEGKNTWPKADFRHAPTPTDLPPKPRE